MHNAHVPQLVSFMGSFSNQWHNGLAWHWVSVKLMRHVAKKSKYKLRIAVAKSHTPQLAEMRVEK